MRSRDGRGATGAARSVRSTYALLAILLAVLVTLPTALSSTAPASAARADSPPAPHAPSTVTRTLREPFSREIVRPGDVDADPYNIEHVYEVQRRLTRLGLFDAIPNGQFGPVTRAGVETFQRSNDLPVTGVVNPRTWRPLIKQTVLGKRAVPKACKARGWHACYDRLHHQVSLYRRGVLLNSWLVRGGAADTQTRTGNFVVYYRDIDHVSGLYDDAPMPYSQFFSGGQALHGSRLMMDPYVGHSHGCVNFWVEDARQLWRLTSTKRLHVHVYGDWN